MIKLIKSAFYKEEKTRGLLAKFIKSAEMFSMGKESKKFEEAFTKKQGRKYAVFVNSGSSANLALLQAFVNLGWLKKGDHVGVSALTWATNVMPIIQLGMTPVVIDCELDTLNVSPRTLAPYVDVLDGLFITNVLGFSDDIGRIRDICKKKKILFFEDNCESLGSKVDGELLGNFGVASTFSFFVGHHFSTIEGGMICTDDEELYHMLVMVRAHGWDRNLPEHKKLHLKKKHGVDDFFSRYTFYDLAYNLRPTEIQGYLGNIQLPYLPEIIAARRKNFDIFDAAIKRNKELLAIATDHMDVVSNFAIPVVAKDKGVFESLKKRFADSDVEIRPIIAGNIAKHVFYTKHNFKKTESPNADYIHAHGFYFGNNPELTKAELKLLEKLLA